MNPRRLLAFLLFGLTALAAASAPAAAYHRAALESQVRARILAEATRRGLVAQVDGVRVGLRPPLLITGLRVTRPGRWSVTADTAAFTLRARGQGLLGRARLALGPMKMTAPGGVTVDLVPTVWDIGSDNSGASTMMLREPAIGLTLTRRPAREGAALEAHAARAPVGSLLVFLTSYQTTFLITAIMLVVAVGFNLVTGLQWRRVKAKEQAVSIARSVDSSLDVQPESRSTDTPTSQNETNARRTIVAFFVTANALSSMTWVTMFTFFPALSESIGIPVLILGAISLAATGGRFLTYLVITKESFRRRLLDVRNRNRNTSGAHTAPFIRSSQGMAPKNPANENTHPA